MERQKHLQVARSVEEMQLIRRNHHQEQLPPPKQPQKCPRCDSDNTKFCYYNNYSVSQPRYFCKSCRRYWTHGGTLRDIPVGGSTRKAKRARASEARNPRSQPPPPPPPEAATAKSPVAIGNNNNLEIEKAMGIPPMSSYYPGNGFLSTLADIQILSTYNQTPPTLLQDFTTSHGVPSFGLTNVKTEQDSQLENRDKSGTEYYSMYPNSRSGSVGSWNQTPTMNNHTSGGATTSNNNSTASIGPVLWSGDLQGLGLEM